MDKKQRKTYFHFALIGFRKMKEKYTDQKILEDLTKVEEYYSVLGDKYRTHEAWKEVLTQSVKDYRDKKLTKSEMTEHENLVDLVREKYLSVSHPLIATVKPCLEDLKSAFSHHPRKYAGMLELIDRYITIHEKAEDAEPKVRVVRKAPNRIVEQLFEASNPVKRLADKY